MSGELGKKRYAQVSSSMGLWLIVVTFIIHNIFKYDNRAYKNKIILKTILN